MNSKPVLAGVNWFNSSRVLADNSLESDYHVALNSVCFISFEIEWSEILYQDTR